MTKGPLLGVWTVSDTLLQALPTHHLHCFYRSVVVCGSPSHGSLSLLFLFFSLPPPPLSCSSFFSSPFIPSIIIIVVVVLVLLLFVADALVVDSLFCYCYSVIFSLARPGCPPTPLPTSRRRTVLSRKINERSLCCGNKALGESFLNLNIYHFCCAKLVKSTHTLFEPGSQPIRLCRWTSFEQ